MLSVYPGEIRRHMFGLRTCTTSIQTYTKFAWACIYLLSQLGPPDTWTTSLISRPWLCCTITSHWSHHQPVPQPPLQHSTLSSWSNLTHRHSALYKSMTGLALLRNIAWTEHPFSIISKCKCHQTENCQAHPPEPEPVCDVYLDCTYTISFNRRRRNPSKMF